MTLQGQRTRKLSLFDLSQGEEDVKNNIDEISPHKRFNRFNDLIEQTLYKTVYRAYDQQTGKEVRWNVLSMHVLQRSQLETATKQIEAIRRCEHKHLVNYIDGWISNSRKQIVYVTESVTSHNLRKHLQKIRRPKLKIIKGWCLQLLSATEYLHSNNLIHGNIRCANIGINANTNELKLGELGCIIGSSKSTDPVLGNPRWSPPELFEDVYSQAMDIYAFGMTLLEMLTVKDPYSECTNSAQVYKKIYHGVKPKLLDQIRNSDLKSIISSCISDEKDRPTAKQLLELAFWRTQQDTDNQPVPVQPQRPSIQKHLETTENDVWRKTRKSITTQYEEEDVKHLFKQGSLERRDKETETVFLINFEGKKKVELHIQKSQYQREDYEDLVNLLSSKLSEKTHQKQDQTTAQQTKSQCDTKKVETLYQSRAKEDSTNHRFLNEISHDINEDLESKCSTEKKEMEQIQLFEKDRRKQVKRKYGNVRPSSPSEVKNLIDILNNQPEQFIDQFQTDKQEAFKNIIRNDEVLTFNYDSELSNEARLQDIFHEKHQQLEIEPKQNLLKIPIFTITETKQQSKSKQQSSSSLEKPGLAHLSSD